MLHTYDGNTSIHLLMELFPADIRSEVWFTGGQTAVTPAPAHRTVFVLSTCRMVPSTSRSPPPSDQPHSYTTVRNTDWTSSGSARNMLTKGSQQQPNGPNASADPTRGGTESSSSCGVIPELGMHGSHLEL